VTIMAADPYNFRFIKDPIKLGKVLWPEITFYKKEREIIYSVWDNDETVVPAAHKVGKDWTAAFICLAFFLTRHPCRVLTTSVDGYQLEGVLWGEIRNFIQRCRYPLEHDRGGPLVVNHLHIRKVVKDANGDKQVDGLSYIIGRVAEHGEGISGHHIADPGDGVPRTLFIADEASGVDEETFEKATEWAHRTLIIGNPYDCRNAFYYAVEGNPKTNDPGGDVPRAGGRPGFSRKVIHIEGEDSPNVRLARAQIACGEQPTGEVLVPGVLSWAEYQERERKWPEPKKVPGLYGRFYKGGKRLMFPEPWLNRAHHVADMLRGRHRQGLGLGCDPGEGEADTSIAVVDDLGLIELFSQKTPNTVQIVNDVIAYGKRWGVEPEDWVLDSGGGGKQIADRLRELGYPVRTVAFGAAVMMEQHDGIVLTEERVDTREERTAYTNRRAQMYGEFRDLIDPDNGSEHGWGIPRTYDELRRQLVPIPLLYDQEGRLYMLPKNRRDPKDRRQTLTEIIGRSPDDADATVLAVHGMLHKVWTNVAGAG
jgi:hypothetical protein